MFGKILFRILCVILKSICYFYLVLLQINSNLPNINFSNLTNIFSTTLFSQPNIETLITNTQLIISMKLRKSFVSINIKRTWLNKEKFAKNTFIYLNSIVFSWAFVSLKKKKKAKNTFKSPLIFVFITMAHTAQIAVK